MTTNRNHDDTLSKIERIKTCDNDDVRPWSDLNHDLLLLVMMQLGVVDFLAFGGVCKSWRSVALPNKKQFMASKPPMLMCISTHHNIDNECCCLEDSQGRKFKTIIPHSAGRSFLGLTCGYMILCGWKPRDFWLVNPITRHELHFPPVPSVFHCRLVLVFSPSISRYMFVMLDIDRKRIWYSIAGERAWKFVSSTQCLQNLHAFKGKIYTISSGNLSSEIQHLCELTLYPEPKLTLLKIKNFLNEDLLYPAELVHSGENLYLVRSLSAGGLYEVHKLDFDKMEWEHFVDARDEHEQAFFLSHLRYGANGAVVKPESWADSRSQHGRFHRHGRFFTANQWYFPHECLNAESLR